jgi:hypothetical protein
MSDLSRTISLGLGLTLVLGACVLRQGGSDAAGARSQELGTCAAGAHQDWVGQSVSVLNDDDLPEGTRVLFPTTPATMDFNEDRMNVEVDGSDRIARVYCG